MKKILLQATFVVASLSCVCSLASVTNPCNDEPNENARLLCKAKFELDTTKCEKITNLDLKQHCILNVREKQRSITWSVNSKKPSES